MKRAFDIAVSGVALVILALPMLVLAAFVYCKLGSPIFFRQLRPGLAGEGFTLVKFRTMRDARDAAGTLLPDVERLPPFGRWLRASSLDELPELYNVLKGDMSLVGPRPLLMEYLPLYSPEQARRHEVRPGLTGWAQVNGRNSIGWPAKFALDVWYVDNHTLWLDIRVLAITFAKVWRREGVTADNSATADKFEGNG